MKKVLGLVLVMILMLVLGGNLFATDVTLATAINGAGAYGIYVPVPNSDLKLGGGGKFSVNSDQTTTNGWFAVCAYGFELDANIIDNRLVSFSLMKGFSQKINETTSFILSLGLIEIETKSDRTITFLPFCTPYVAMDIKI
jgi:hypothetical protein